MKDVNLHVFIRRHWLAFNALLFLFAVLFAIFFYQALVVPSADGLASWAWGLSAVGCVAVVIVFFPLRGVVGRAFSRFALYGHLKNLVLVRKGVTAKDVEDGPDLITEQDALMEDLSVVEIEDYEHLPFVSGGEHTCSFGIGNFNVSASLSFSPEEWSKERLFALAEKIFPGEIAIHARWNDVLVRVKEQLEKSLDTALLYECSHGTSCEADPFESAIKGAFASLDITVMEVRDITVFDSAPLVFAEMNQTAGAL